MWPALNGRNLDLWVGHNRLKSYYWDVQRQDGTPQDQPTLLRSDRWAVVRLTPGVLGEPEDLDRELPTTVAIELALRERSPRFWLAGVAIEPGFRPGLTLEQQLAGLGMRAEDLRLIGADPWLGALYEWTAFEPADGDDPSRAAVVISSAALGRRQVTAVVVIRDDGDGHWDSALFHLPADVGFEEQHLADGTIGRRVRGTRIGRDREARFERWERVVERAGALRAKGQAELALPWVRCAAFGEDHALLGEPQDRVGLAARHAALDRALQAPPGDPELLLALLHEADRVDCSAGQDGPPLLVAHRERLIAHAAAAAAAARDAGLFATALTLEWLRQELLPAQGRTPAALGGGLDALLSAGRLGAVHGLPPLEGQGRRADLLLGSPAARLLRRALTGEQLAALPGVPAWTRAARDEVQLDLSEGQASERVRWFVSNPEWERWQRDHTAMQANVRYAQDEVDRWEREYVPPDPWRSHGYSSRHITFERVGSVWVQERTPDPQPIPRPPNPHLPDLERSQAILAEHARSEPSRGEAHEVELDYRWQRWRGTFARVHSLQDAEGRELATRRTELSIDEERRQQPGHAPAGRSPRSDLTTREELLARLAWRADDALAPDAVMGWRRLMALALPTVLERALPAATPEARAREAAFTLAWLGHPDHESLRVYSDLFTLLVRQPVELLRSRAAGTLADGLRPELPHYSLP